jgi:hypothetical protein
VVKRGDLGDHPANADARHVRRTVVNRASEGRRIGNKIAQRVRGASGSTVLDSPESRRSYRTT